MASASRRYLPLLLGFLVLALWGAGCFDRASGTAFPDSPNLSQEGIAVLVARSLTTSGTPQPPLSRSSTREERGAYLSSAQHALDQLEGIAGSRAEGPSSAARLLLEDRNDQILAISQLLAVELADSIDKADPRRATRALQLAAVYADSVAARSVPDWSASAAVADTLLLGVKSVSDQLDQTMAETLVEAASSFRPPKGADERVRALDAKRIAAWLRAAQETKEPVKPESIPLFAGLNPASRAHSSQEFKDSLKHLAPNGIIPADVFVAECRVAAEQVIAYLGDPRGPLPSVDGTRHPVAAMLLTILHPTFSAAADLSALHAENWQMLALAIRLEAGELPESLDDFGDLAISPVSQLPFEYVRRETDFDLVRPRAKAGDKP